jgi:hypothetical protein
MIRLIQQRQQGFNPKTWHKLLKSLTPYLNPSGLTKQVSEYLPKKSTFLSIHYISENVIIYLENKDLKIKYHTCIHTT